MQLHFPLNRRGRGQNGGAGQWIASPAPNAAGESYRGLAIIPPKAKSPVHTGLSDIGEEKRVSLYCRRRENVRERWNAHQAAVGFRLRIRSMTCSASLSVRLKSTQYRIGSPFGMK